MAPYWPTFFLKVCRQIKGVVRLIDQKVERGGLKRQKQSAWSDCELRSEERLCLQRKKTVQINISIRCNTTMSGKMYGSVDR
jgi:hypothetical protein